MKRLALRTSPINGLFLLLALGCSSLPPSPNPTPAAPPAPSGTDPLSQTTGPGTFATIALEATGSTWRDDTTPYDIYSAVKTRLAAAGFNVVQAGRGDYTARLFIEYEEQKGAQYRERVGGYVVGNGTHIRCTLRLFPKGGDLLFKKVLIASTSPDVGWTTQYSTSDYWETMRRQPAWATVLYRSAVEQFEEDPYFQYLGEIIAAKLGIVDEVAFWAARLRYEDRRDEDWHVRLEAAMVLGTMGDARATESLIQALVGESAAVREAAATALGMIGDPRAIEPLTQSLSDERDDVRVAAKDALRQIAERSR